MMRGEPLAIGERVGSFRVIGHLIGNTYRALHVDGTRRVLIEVAPVEQWRETIVEMLRAQRLVEALQHPGVAPIIDRGVLPDHRPWMATEVPSGLGLYELIARRTMPAAEATALIRDIADVLAHAHARGVVHRALTMRSIVIATGGRAYPLCICDWGLRVDDLGVFGAPELTMGGSFDGRVDVFAVGVIAFRAVTGRFPGERGVYDMPGIADGLATLIARMLAISPFERPNAAEVRDLASGLLATDFTDRGDNVLYAGGPRFATPKWTPAPPELVIRTSERAPTASGEITPAKKS